MYFTFPPSCVARQISSFTLGKCWPVQQATESFGDALSRCLTTDRSCMFTRPDDALPWLLREDDGGWFMPWLYERTSIHFGCFSSVLSPSTPSIFRYASNAMTP